MSKTLQNGSFQDAVGTVVNGGTIEFVLSHDAMIIAGGQVAPTRVSATLNSTGDMPANFTILANDELTPSGTFYLTTVFDSNGARVFGPERWVFSGASPIDLDTLTPTIVDPAFADPILSNPVAAQAIADFDLSTPLLNGVRVVDGTKFATIQAAIDDVPSAGGLVFIPAGTYTTSSTVLLKSNLHLSGAGRDATIIKLTDSADVTVLQAPNGTVDISVSHLTVDGNRANQTDTAITGISILSTTGSPSARIALENLYILNVRNDGILIDGATTDVRISNNFIDGTDLGAGIELASGTNTTTRVIVSNNNIRNVRTAGIAGTGPITHVTISGNTIDTTVTADCITAYNQANAFITVTGNTCENSGNHGIHVTGDDVTISDNVIDSPTNNGVFLSHSAETPPSQATRISVTGNSTNDGVFGISVFNTQSVSIVGNTINSPSNGGIQHTIDTTANASNFFVIANNVIRGATNDGIGLREGINHGSVGGNVIEGCGRDGIRIADTGTGPTGIVVALNRATGNTGFGIKEQNNASANLFYGNLLAGNTSGAKSLLTNGADFETETTLLASLEDVPSNTPRWIFKQVDHTDMTAGATADTFTLFTLPANTMIHDVVGTVVTAWAGTGPVSAAVASVGTNAGAANDLTLDDNFFSAATVYELHDATASGGKGTLLFDATDKFAPHMFVAGGVVELQMDLTGGNHSATSAGQARIYMLISQPLGNTTTEAN